MRKGKYLAMCMLLGLSVLAVTPQRVMAEETNAIMTELSKATTTITVSVTEGTDIAKAVNDALKEATEKATAENPYKIVIPAGSYKLSTVLRMNSNITLDATGATIQYDAPGETHNLIISGTIDYNNSSACSGYKGYENMAIIGGRWVSTDYNGASLVKIVHAKNVTIKNATFEGGGGIHMVEVCAIDNFKVTGCTFKNFKWNGSDTAKQEALQFDIPCAESIYKDTYQDGTMMKNVTVSGCTFDNVPRGMGTHTMLLGAYHENIKIQNNTFKNIKEEAIVTVNYYNCEISGNTIKNCGAGILMQTFKQKLDSIYSSVEDGTYKQKSYDDLKANIHDNTFEITYNTQCDAIQSIKTFGMEITKGGKGADGKTIAAGDYRVKGVTVKNNTIKTAGQGIVFSGSTNCLADSNTVTGGAYSDADPNKGGYDGVFVAENCDNITVSNNTIESVIRNGIFVKTNSKIQDITGNTITTPSYNGISIADDSQVVGAISENVINTPIESGISITTGSDVASVLNNQILYAKGQGINIFDNSSVSVEITGNTISKPKSNGIIVNKKSSVATILKNKITSPAISGINVCASSKVTKGITSNTISKPKANGIIVNKGTVAAIKKNKISSPSGQGMNICASSKVTKEITGNTISKPKSNGIIINKSTVGAIKNNKITSPGGHGMNIYMGSKVTKTISGNTITNAKGNGIMVNNKCTVLDITGNTINKTTESGINVFKSCTVKKNIEKNKISNTKKNGIMINQKSKVGSVLSNIIKSPKGAGILLCNKAIVNGSILKNKITKAKNGNIKVTSGAKVKGKCQKK